jgi:hypothetical protein
MKLNLLLLLIFCCSLNSNVCTENEKNVEINTNLQRELEPPKPSKNFVSYRHHWSHRKENQLNKIKSLVIERSD